MEKFARLLLRAAARKADERSRVYAGEADSQTTRVEHSGRVIMATTPESDIARKKSAAFASLRDQMLADGEDLTWLGDL